MTESPNHKPDLLDRLIERIIEPGFDHFIDGMAKAFSYTSKIASLYPKGYKVRVAQQIRDQEIARILQQKRQR